MKIFFSAIILLLSFTADSQVEYGIFAGPQITDVRYLINEKTQSSSMKVGVNAGVQLKVPFEGRLSFAPSIMYNMRGYKVKFNAPSFPPDLSAIDNNTQFHTVELGFLLQHDFTSNSAHYFIRFGPSLDFALFGNEKFNTNMNTKVDRAMKFSFADYGHYLASAIAQFGYEAQNGLFFYAYYNYSLTSMNNADNGPTIYNRATGISIGKYLKRNKVVIDTKNKQ